MNVDCKRAGVRVKKKPQSYGWWRVSSAVSRK